MLQGGNSPSISLVEAMEESMRVRLRVGYVGWTHSATSPKCPTGADAASPQPADPRVVACSPRPWRARLAGPPQPANPPARRQPAVRPALGAHASRRPAPARRQPARSRYLTRYFASVSFSFSISIGLDRWSFMPDSLARATSSVKALAVMAMMGTSAASGLSHRRMARVAS